MRTMFGLVLIVGLALAGFAVYMTQSYFSKTQAQLNQELELRAKTGPLVEVFVVNKTKAYGDVLTKEDVQLIYWPKNALPEHAFTDAKLLFPDDGKTPRYITRQFEKFEPVLGEKITEPGQMAGLTGQLAKGQRAFAIKVDVASGVSGFVQPGDRVDVYWTGLITNATNNGTDTTKLIESGVKIIAVDQTADGGNGAAVVARTVTVAASPEQVARLAQAAATGKLALSLVGTTDDSVSGKIEVDSNQLLGISPEAVAAAAAPEKVCTIKTRKGADVADTPIPCTN